MTNSREEGGKRPRRGWRPRLDRLGHVHEFGFHPRHPVPLAALPRTGLSHSLASHPLGFGFPIHAMSRHSNTASKGPCNSSNFLYL